MKNICFLITLVCVIACNKERPAPRKTIDWGACCSPSFDISIPISYTESVLGDRDGFGNGLQDGELLILDTTGTGFPVDFRSGAVDSEYTDIFPANLNGDFEYTHTFEPSQYQITRATLYIGTVGIEDMVLANIDVKLFIDGEEVEGAFDDLNQTGNYNGVTYQKFESHQLILPQEVLHHLEDGEVTVTWSVVNTIGDNMVDYFGIDYSRLGFGWNPYSSQPVTTNQPDIIYQPDTTSQPDTTINWGEPHWIELGDGDNFGTNLEMQDVIYWYPDTTTSLPVDNRREDDPPFTDIYPASNDGLIEFELAYEAIQDSIGWAYFEIYAYGVQDGDMYNIEFNNTDIKFYIDEIEIAGAFDQVNQMMINEGIPYRQAPGHIRLDVPQEALVLIKDGKLSVRIEVHQYGSSSELNKFAIDYINLFYNTY